jgi:hypothetical protein
MEEIYVDEIECPLCDRETCCEFWDIEVEQDVVRRTRVKCDECGGEFVIKTKLAISVEKQPEKI